MGRSCEGHVNLKLSSCVLGMRWKCTCLTTWPAMVWLFCRIFRPGESVASLSALAILGINLREFAARSCGSWSMVW